jgi:hypothetical protein
MRAALITLPIMVAATLLTATPAAIAQNAPWCALGDLTGIEDCSYYTLAQCRATLSTEPTGTCSRNPLAGRAQASRARR